MTQQSSESEDPNKPVHFRPIMATDGDYWVPRWIGGLLRDEEITRSEALALIFVADQVQGWKTSLGREYVHLSRSDWADLLSMTPKGAAGVRDSLLRKGLLRRRKASEAPEAQESQARTGYQYTYIHPDERGDLAEIKEAADPSSRQNGEDRRTESCDDEIPF